MTDEKIPLVRPAELKPLPPNNQPPTPVPVPAPSPPPPPPLPRRLNNATCLGKFCPEAVNVGAIERKYYEGTPEETAIRLKGPKDFKPSLDVCKMYLFSILINGCDGNDPQNPQNYKGSGKETIDDVSYEIQPNSLKQLANNGKNGACDSTYKVYFNEYVVWGHGWDNSDFDEGFKNQLKGCALLPGTWHFNYGLGSDRREWTAKFRTGVFQRKCVGHAAISADAPPNISCGGSG